LTLGRRHFSRRLVMAARKARGPMQPSPKQVGAALLASGGGGDDEANAGSLRALPVPFRPVTNVDGPGKVLLPLQASSTTPRAPTPRLSPRLTRDGDSTPPRASTFQALSAIESRMQMRVQELEDKLSKALALIDSQRAAAAAPAAPQVEDHALTKELREFRESVSSKLCELDVRLTAIEEAAEPTVDVQVQTVPANSPSHERSQVRTPTVGTLVTDAEGADAQSEPSAKHEDTDVCRAMFSSQEASTKPKPQTPKPMRVVLGARSKLIIETDDEDEEEEEGQHPHVDKAVTNATSRSRHSSQLEHRTLTFASHSSAKYSLKESVWDASLFAGYAHMGLGANVLLGIGVVLNIVIQMTLCAIIAKELSVDAYDDEFIGSLGEWRRNATSSTLEAVCSEDPTLSTSAFQAETYAGAREFTSSWISPLVETGPLLSVTVIFMWTLSVVDVLRGACDFLLAVIQLHKQKAADRFSIGVLASNEFVIEGVTMHRLVWAVLMGVLQLIIAAVLLLSGAMWLAYTKSIPDLLANAVALSYVMQVDELLYQVIVPRRAKALITNIMPIDMRGQSARFKVEGIPKQASATLLLAMGFLAFIVFGFVFPHADRMRQVRDDICPA